MNLLSNSKVAIVYDRVNKFGGAERVLLTLHEMFPDAPLYTSVYNPETAQWAKVFPKINTSFLQNFKFARNNHQFFGWLMPLVFEQFDFKDYDLVISVTSEASKGIITGTNTTHICYMLTPTRYLWSGYDFYFKNILFKLISLPTVNYLRWWDKVASQRPDKIIAISTEVQKRIKKYYNRESEVIFPCVDLHRKNSLLRNGSYFLIHGRFEPYKRLDLVINVFKNIDKQLVVSGSGSEFDKYKKLKYPNIKFIEKPTDIELLNLYSDAMAFLMPQDEDFGITAVEAQSFGVPVIAFKSGGAHDTVIDGVTGLFFENQTMSSLKQAIAKFDTMSFNRENLIKNAEKFSKDRFKRELQRSFVRSYSSWRGRNSSLAKI
jgi:glycosyltransferase involved in cell wall biosynthesis